MMYHSSSRHIWALKQGSNYKLNPIRRHVKTLPQLRCTGRVFHILHKFTLPHATLGGGGFNKKSERLK